MQEKKIKFFLNSFNHKLVLSIVLALLFTLNGAFLRSMYLLAAIGVLGVILFLLTINWKKLTIKINSKLFIILITLLASIPLIALKSFFYEVAYVFIFTTITSILIAKNFSQVNINPFAKFTLIVLLIYFFSSILFGVDPAEIFAGSRNQISVLLISFLVLNLASKNLHNFFDLLLALFVWVACLYGGGVGGIISSTVILFALCYFLISSRIIIIILCVILSCSYYFLFDHIEISENILLKYNLERLLVLDTRYQIIAQYYDRYFTEPVFFILGAPDDYVFDVYDYFSFGGGGIDGEVSSLHNSYLSIHAKIGFLAIFVIYSLGRLAYFLSGSCFHLIIFLALLLRAFSDSVYILDGYYNFCLFYFYFLNSSINNSFLDYKRNLSI
jgi:hypothetical protein